MITNDIIIVTLHYFGWQVMPEYHWNHWIDPIVFPYILPITQIALTGVVVYDISGRKNVDNIEFLRIEINIPWVGPKDVQKTSFFQIRNNHIFVSGSVYSVVAVALERYFNICKPFNRNLVSTLYRPLWNFLKNIHMLFHNQFRLVGPLICSK